MDILTEEINIIHDFNEKIDDNRQSQNLQKKITMFRRRRELAETMRFYEWKIDYIINNKSINPLTFKIILR